MEKNSRWKPDSNQLYSPMHAIPYSHLLSTSAFRASVKFQVRTNLMESRVLLGRCESFLPFVFACLSSETLRRICSFIVGLGDGGGGQIEREKLLDGIWSSGAGPWNSNTQLLWIESWVKESR